jgi:hypothetical protein
MSIVWVLGNIFNITGFSDINWIVMIVWPLIPIAILMGASAFIGYLCSKYIEND